MAKSKIFKIVVSILVVLCVLCTAPLYLDTLITISLNLLAPRTKQFDAPKPQLLHEFPSGVYEFYWSDDASHLILNISNWTSSNPDAPDTIADYNLETDEVVFQEEITSSNQVSPPELIERLGIDTEFEYWALCAVRNRAISAGGFEGEQYWLKYWEDEELVDTFYFSSEQWPVDYLTPYASIEFSPSCSKVTLILSGWIYHEGEGDEELWLLDIPSRIFERLIIGKSPIFGLWDYPVQYVTPSWSPNEDQFVFGGWTFGLEVYDLSRSKRKILAGPHYNLHSAKWSPSGKWIAAIQSGDDLDSLNIFSTDGSLRDSTEGCDLITDFQWAPEEDMIAFICYGECNELCTESYDNLCENNCDDPCANLCHSSDYLWLWDLE